MYFAWDAWMVGLMLWLVSSKIIGAIYAAKARDVCI